MSDLEIQTSSPLIALGSGEQITQADEILLNDFSSLNADAFINKYGEDTFNSLVQQRDAVSQAANNVLLSDTRGWGEATRDAAKNIITGALTGVTGAASLLTTPIKPVSETFARATRAINEASQALGSDAEKAQRELYNFQQQGLKARLDRETREAEAQGKTVSTLENIGKEALGTIDNLFKTGQISEIASSGIGSLLVGGPMTKGITKAASFVGSKAPTLAKAINKAADQSAVINKIKEASPWMTAMGLQEGGGTYGDLLLQGLDMPTEELLANSPEFQTLYADYRKTYSDDEAAKLAKQDLAYVAAREAGLLTAVGAGAANILTAGMGKGISNAGLAKSILAPFTKTADTTIDKFIADSFSEPIEEGISEGLGQLASNYATREYLDKNQTLTEDVGQSIGEGASGGLGVTAARAIGLALGNVPTAAQYIKNEMKRKPVENKDPGTITLDFTMANPSDSPLKVSEDFEDTRTPTQVATDSLEEVNQNKDTLSSLFNPETSLSDEETGFNTSSLDLAPELKEHYGVETKAELLNKLVSDQDAEGEELQKRAQDLTALLPSIQKDLNNLTAFLAKAKEGKVSVTPEELTALEAQRKSLLAAKKNYFDAAAAYSGDENLEAEKTAYDAIHHPERVTPESINKALKSSLSFTDTEREVLTSIRDFFAQEELNTKHRETIKEISPQTSLVSQNVIWGTDEAYKESNKYSLRQLGHEVYKGVSSGNMEQARNGLSNLQKLVQHFENKVKAANASYKNGGKEVKFDRLNAKTKKFDKNKGTIYWKPTEENSLALARAIQYDLARTVQAYNHLIKLAPDLGFKKIDSYQHLVENKGKGTEVPEYVYTEPTETTEQQPIEPEVIQPEVTVEETVAPEENQQQPEQTVVEEKVPEQKEETIKSSEESVAQQTQEEPKAEVAPKFETKQEAPTDDATYLEELETELEYLNSQLESTEDSTDRDEISYQIREVKEKIRSFKADKSITPSQRLKALKNSFKEVFKNSPLASLFNIKRNVESRGILGAVASKFNIITDIINDDATREEFLSYDADPEKAAAITQLSAKEKKVWTSFIKGTAPHIVQGINQKAKDTIKYIEHIKNVPLASGKARKNPYEIAGNFYLNFFDRETGKFPEELTRAVSLALMSSILQTRTNADPYEIAEKYGINNPYSLTENDLFLLQNGIPLQNLINSVINKTKDYLNITSDVNIPLGQTDGVIAALAYSAIESLIGNSNTKLELGTDTIEAEFKEDEDSEVDGPTRKRTFLTLVSDLDSEIQANTNFLDNLFFNTGSKSYKEYWGNTPVPIDETIKHSDIPLEQGQKDAIKARQEVEYSINEEMFKHFNNMGIDGLIAFFSEDPTGKEDLYHKDYLLTLEGRNSAIKRAFYEVNHSYEIASRIAKKKKIPLNQVKRHYKYGVSKVGRYMMEGSVTPQGDKLCREVWSATECTVDLSDKSSELHHNYIRCIAQAFGIKVNNLTFEEIQNEVNTRVNAEKFQEVRDYFAKESPTLEDVKHLKNVFKALDIDVSFVSFACASDYCRYLKADENNQLSSYTTNVYLEADGVTNGTANLLMLANSQNLTKEDLTARRRIGVNIGSSEPMSLAQIKNKYPEAKKDTYTWTAEKIYDDLKKEGTSVAEAYKTIYSFFGLWDNKNDFFSRNVVKNPVTTVGYGAGVPTLAKKLYGDLALQFNTKVSHVNLKYVSDKNITWAMAFTGAESNQEAIKQIQALNNAFRTITGNTATLLPSSFIEVTGNKKEFVQKIAKLDFLAKDSEIFIPLAGLINGATEENLGAEHHFDEHGIKHTMQYFNTLNTVSYFLQEFVYNTLLNKVLGSLSPEQKAFGLSPKQIKEIQKEVRKFALLPKSNLQVISPNKYKREVTKNIIFTAYELNADIAKQLGISVNKFKTVKFAPEMRKPANPRVALMPSLIQGFGDAHMMTLLANRKRATDVYDGWNSSLDMVNEDALAANKAVYDTWQLNLGTVMKEAYLEATQFASEELFQQMIDQIAKDKNLYKNEFIKFVARSFYRVYPKKISEITVNSRTGVTQIVVKYTTNKGVKQLTLDGKVLFDKLIKTQKGLLDFYEVRFAKNIAALNAVDFSDDQMASAETPFFHEGTVKTNSTEEAIRAFNSVFNNTKVKPSVVELDSSRVNPLEATFSESKLANLEKQEVSEEPKETVTEPEQPKVEPVEVTVPEEKNITIDRNELKVSPQYLLEILQDLSAKQKKLYNAIKGLGVREFLQNFTVYSGSKEELNQLLKEDGELLDVHFDEKTKGIFNPESKTLYILGDDPSTVFHEMIHAFVADKINTVCQNLGSDFTTVRKIPGVDMNTVAAVISLKKVLDQFLKEEVSFENDPRIAEVQGIIQRLADKGDIAGAINEMVAYSLSDEIVSNFLYTKKADYINRASEIKEEGTLFNVGLSGRILDYFAKTIKLVKKILFGSTYSDPNDTLLDEMAFYTRIINTGSVDNVIFSDVLNALSSDIQNKIPAFKQISDLVTKAIQKRSPDANKAAAFRTHIVNNLKAEIQKNIPSMDVSELNACALILEAFLGVNKVNPEVFSRIADMYHYARSKVTVEDFMSDPTDSTQRPVAEQKYYALFGDSLTTNKELKVPTFFAIALTSSEVKKILSKIEVKRVKASNADFFLDKKIEEAGTFVINKLSDILNASNASNVDELLNALADSLIKTSLAEGYKPSKVKKQVDTLNEKLGKAVQKGAEKAINWEASNKHVGNIFVKVIKTFVAATAIPFAKEDTVQRAFNAAERELSSTVNKHNALGHLITDIIGRTGDNGLIYDLIKPIKAEVQQLRTRFKEEVPQALKEQFSRKLEDSELKTLYYGLGKIDISALGLGPIIARYFNSPVLVTNTINTLEQKIGDQEMIAKAKALATYLVTNKVTDSILLRNAEAIVAKLHKNKLGEGSTQTTLHGLDKNLVKAVDQLVSLYAIQQLDSKTKGTINKLFKSEPKGMNILVGSLRYLKEHEARKYQGNARFNALKGYIPTESNNGYSIVLGTSKDEAALLKAGYIKQEAYSGAKDTYYYTLDFSQSTFNEGIFQIIKESVNGSDIVTGFSHELYGKLTGDEARKYYRRTKNAPVNSEEALIPVWNHQGILIGYEKNVSNAIKNKYLDPKYDVTKSIGLMQGRLKEEELARIKNRALIRKLKTSWNNATFSQRRGYIDLEKRLENDPVLKESWELIPYHYRQELKQEFNDGPIMVPATLVEDILGIRAASIGDIYTGNSRWSPKTQAYIRAFFKLFFGADEGKAYRVLTKLENTLKTSVSALRTTIVVRSLVVPFDNIISNAIDLMICGVSPVVLAKETPKIIIQIEKYLKAQKQLVHIETLLQSKQANRRELEAKKASIEETISKLTDILPLIKAGEFSTVADLNQGDEDASYAAGNYFQMIEKLADKTPKEFNNFARYALITKDTALYKGLHKAVLYGDFVAKCILYKHLTERGQSEKEVLALVKEHFVDYDRISGRTRDYLENTGLLWFYSYKLRILKTALWLLRHNPLYGLMSVFLPLDAILGDVDTPLTENIVSKGKDIVNTMGTSMGERAPFMNLWMQLFT